MQKNILEAILIGALFVVYLMLWAIKRRTLMKQSGIDPQVMAKSKSSLQKFMSYFTFVLTIFITLMLVVKVFNLKFFSMFNELAYLDSVKFDAAGFLLGLAGLSICLYAQLKMGRSWRVGIDEKKKTALITTGLYKFIRNPTYLGLFALNAGVWMIFPCWAVFLFAYSFYLFLEVQVRCEEDFLLKLHGKKYAEYMKHTKRYIPFIY